MISSHNDETYPPEVPRNLTYPSLTLGEILNRAAEKRPFNPCILFNSQKYNFRQVDQISDRIADGLLSIGYKKGDRIGILLPNIPQFVFAFFGILKMGGIVVAINPNYQTREIKQQVITAGVTGLFLLDTRIDLSTELLTITAVHKFIHTKPEEYLSAMDIATKSMSEKKSKPSSVISLENLISLQRSEKIKQNFKIKPDDAAIFQFSGGTTGTPKAAIGLHRNVVANVFQFRAWLHSIEDEHNPFLVAIPLFHVYGMVLGMVLAILMGCPMILIERSADITEIFKQIRLEKPSVFPCVPSLFYAMLHYADLENYKEDLKVLKVCVSGSASLQPEVKSAFEKLIGGKLIEGYGLSEAPTATHCNPISGDNKTSSIGLPLPDVACRLISLDDGRSEVETGRLGELVIRGPQVMKEYYNNEDETKTALREGWLYTGDIAWKDSKGYYFIKGRKKDLIKVGGLQVWPQEIEEVIQLLEGVKETTAAGIPDDYLGEVVIAWVVLKPGSYLKEADILAHCSENIARHKVPARILFIDQLPRTTVGKVLRRELVSYIKSKKD